MTKTFLVALLFSLLSGLLAACVSQPTTGSDVKAASWLQTPVLPPNTVLHWRQMTYVFKPGASDPANGKELLGDLWLQVGGEGQVTLFKALYAYLDGTFHQALFETGSLSLFVEGKDYAPRQPTTLPPGWCVQRQSSNASLLQSQVPSFVNEAILAQDGFQRQEGTLTKTLPITPNLSGTLPLKVYEGQTTGEIWVSQQVSSNATREISIIEVGSEDRLLVEETQTQQANGTSEQTSWDAIGPLYIYNAAAIPASDLALPAVLTTGACNL